MGVPGHTTRIGTHLIQPISRFEPSGRTRVRSSGSAHQTAWGPRPEPKTEAEPPVHKTIASVSHSIFRILEFCLFQAANQPLRVPFSRDTLSRGFCVAR